MSKVIKNYIYKSKMETTVVVKPTTFKEITGVTGKVIQTVTVKPIKLKFDNCHCIVDESFAREHGLELEDLAKLIEYTAGFGVMFVCIQKPEEVNLEVAKEIKESKKKAPVILGVRK